MHQQELNDEQSAESINSRVMGTRHFTASNSTVSTSAEMLNLRDLRSAASLDRALARIQVLEDQQRESENFFSETRNTQVQKEDPLKKITDCLLQVVEIQKSCLQQNFEMKAEQKERKYNSNTEFYKEAWVYTLRFDPDKQSYSDWRILLKDELVSVRPGGLYWKQLTGEIKRQDMTEDQNKRWDERSQQLLSCLLHSFQGSKMFQLIKDVNVVFNHSGDSGGTLAFKILDKEAFSLSESQEMKLHYQITNLCMKSDFGQYYDCGLYLEQQLIRSPGVMKFNIFVHMWIQGICTEWRHQKSQMLYELTRLINKGKKFNLRMVMERFKTILLEEGLYIEDEKIIINGRDTAPLFLAMSLDKRGPEGNPGVRVMTAAAEETKSTGQQERKKYDGEACTNKHCEQKSSHGTDYCTAYNGNREGRFRSDWSPRYREKLQMQLTKKIKELGQSANAKKNSSEANSSAIEPTTAEERRELIKQLSEIYESEENQQQKDGDVENYHTQFYTCGTAELEPV